MVTPGRSRRLRNCRNFCDTNERGSGGLGVLVLGAPALPFTDGVEDHGHVGVVVGSGVGPGEPRGPVEQGDRRGHPVQVGSVDPGGQQGFSHDSSPVGLVLGDGLAGPEPGGQDAAAEAEVFAVVDLLPALPGDQAG